MLLVSLNVFNNLATAVYPRGASPKNG